MFEASAGGDARVCTNAESPCGPRGQRADQYLALAGCWQSQESTKLYTLDYDYDYHHYDRHHYHHHHHYRSHRLRERQGTRGEEDTGIFDGENWEGG